jgi:hypothetical protein
VNPSCLETLQFLHTRSLYISCICTQLSIMYIILLLCLWIIELTSALRPSHRAPVIFVITHEFTNHTELRGTSIRIDGEYRFGHVSPDLLIRIQTVFPMATILSVHTDDEVGNFNFISEWMIRECFKIQRRMKDDCFVISSHSYPPLKSSLDPYDFRKWESSIKKIVRHALRPVVVTSLGTARPTPPITPSPVVPHSCNDREFKRDCVSPCVWYGIVHGCQTPPFCGFSTKFACEHQPDCVMIRNRCRPRSSQRSIP